MDHRYVDRFLCATGLSLSVVGLALSVPYLLALCIAAGGPLSELLRHAGFAVVGAPPRAGSGAEVLVCLVLPFWLFMAALVYRRFCKVLRRGLPGLVPGFRLSSSTRTVLAVAQLLFWCSAMLVMAGGFAPSLQSVSGFGPSYSTVSILAQMNPLQGVLLLPAALSFLALELWNMAQKHAASDYLEGAPLADR